MITAAGFLSGLAATQARANRWPPLPWDTAQHDPRSPRVARTLGEAIFFMRRHFA